jgi:hypothetical protein
MADQTSWRGRATPSAHLSHHLVNVAAALSYFSFSWQ